MGYIYLREKIAACT